jgi:hypothetical protein
VVSLDNHGIYDIEEGLAISASSYSNRQKGGVPSIRAEQQLAF